MADAAARSRNRSARTSFGVLFEITRLERQIEASRSDFLEWYARYDQPLRAHLTQEMSSARAQKIAEEAFMHLCLARAFGPIKDPRRFLFTTAKLLKDARSLGGKRSPSQRKPLIVIAKEEERVARLQGSRSLRR